MKRLLRKILNNRVDKKLLFNQKYLKVISKKKNTEY